ncbi:hypothetical protein EDC96DRAFT_515298 [Choanephora cucurbitarum]|nr:hypothetical protein EDC96DRAFT_515298 [Choanephora cucurbitarum]
MPNKLIELSFVSNFSFSVTFSYQLYIAMYTLISQLNIITLSIYAHPSVLFILYEASYEHYV